MMPALYCYVLYRSVLIYVFSLRQLVRPVSLRDVVAASVGGDIILHGVLQGEGSEEIHFSDSRPRARLLFDKHISFSSDQ